ncbi:MAG: hypothetical protein EA422_07500 [Gemmatimonadales bacterium]|nr:MAG: hypothetical protein EA422_07500 [Gemmatimonadales bacterium]
MMISGRMYATEAQARGAVDGLREYGIGEDRIFLLSPGADNQATLKGMPSVQATACRLATERGNYVVAVEPYFGEGQSAERIMDSFGPLDGGSLPYVEPRNPAPFSDLLGFPPLSTRGRSYFSAMFPDLTSPNFHFSSKLGMKLLKERKGSWNSSFGLPLLKRTKDNWTSSFGLPLLTKSKRR